MMSSRDTKTIIIFSILLIITTITSTTSLPSLSLSSNELLHCPEQCTCTIISIDTNNRSQNHVKCYGLDGLKEDIKNLSIHSLDLSKNNLTRLTTTALEKLKDLINLDLSFNHLTEIGRFGKRIQKLNISHNKITSGKLSNLPIHLKYLDLSYNDITYLPLDIKNLKYLRSIELTGNKIQCSCETLDVRNWLQNNHVWTDNHIKCTYPIEVKGKSWLQVRQSDVCDQNQKQSSKISSNIDDENELMLGDEAFHNDGSGDKESVEELGKDYLPINDKNDKKLSEYKAIDETDFEGSGGGDEVDISSFESVVTEHQDNTTDSIQVESISKNTGLITDQSNDLDTTEASGVGPWPTIAATIDDDTLSSSVAPNTEEVTEEDVTEPILTDVSEDEEENLNQPPFESSSSEPFDTVISSSTQSSDDIFGQGLGIVEFPTPTTEESASEEPLKEVEEAPIVSVSVNVQENEPSVTSKPGEAVQNAEIQKSSIKVASEGDANEVAEASSSENKNTYILLVIILIVLIALIVVVAVKRSRARNRSRRQGDAENPKETELLDMDNKNLGKPIHKNGNAEHAPLINDRTKSDLAKPVSANGKKVPYEPKENDRNAQEPLLKKDENSTKDLEPKQSQTESNNNVPNSTSPKTTSAPAPIPNQTQEQPVPAVRQHVTSEPSEPVHQYKSGTHAPPSSPQSPRPSRYSPVYSPETGRVKIKLTETPRPKTPLLVTRSRSNAGDIITTPASKADIYKDPISSPTANGGQ